MFVYKSNYRNHWISPYVILTKVCFWEKDEDRIYNLKDEPNNPYVRWVNFLDPICTAWMKFLDFVHPRINYVKIHNPDTWSFDHTLADIILPGLKQLKETKHGAPFIEDEDVPEHLKSTNAPAKENEWDTDDNHFTRWDWVLDQMIFAFEHIVDDTWEQQFWSGEWDRTKKHFEDGWQGTREWDRDGQQIVEDQIKQGLILFGKYFRALWD